MKNKFIWVIGSDGSGKTTIVNNLSKELNIETKHFGPEKSLESGKNRYFNFIKELENNIIVDRFSEGEAIFAPLYRGYDGSEYFNELEKEIKNKFDAILILALPPFEVVKKRLYERGEDFVKEEHFKYCYDKIIEIFNNSSLKKIIIDTDTNNEEKCIEIIKQYL